jgi:predicted RNA binding protein YcfA (HicA-like mRNA interferase family)
MSKLPQISGKECIKALEKVGFFVKRQKGSHIILCRNEPFAEVVIPNHKTLDKGTLRAIIRQVDLDVDKFIKLLNS